MTNSAAQKGSQMTPMSDKTPSVDNAEPGPTLRASAITSAGQPAEPTILDTIAAAARERVDAAKAQVPLEDMRAAALAATAESSKNTIAPGHATAGIPAAPASAAGNDSATAPATGIATDPASAAGNASATTPAAVTPTDPASAADFPFDQALRGDDIAFICECKQASPSKGLIAKDYPYVDIARSYQEAGADAISVLTEPQWFKGSAQHLKEIAAAVDIPVLRKDFVVDPYQIYEAKILGASAILLICSILTDNQLAEYHQLAHSLGMSALVEAHNQVEIDRALLAGASIIGVNNRDLRDFTVEPGRAASFRERVPADVAFVAESGISTPLQVDTLRALGVNAVLIGETLMRAADRRAMLAYLRGSSQVSATISVSRGGGKDSDQLSEAEQ